MTLAKKIIININKGGSSSVQVTGTRGGDCLKMTEKLERALGDVLNVNLTDDYYVSLKNNQHVKEQQ
jgi:hypothetical protein